MSGPLNDLQRVLPVLEMSFQAQQLRMSKVNERIEVLRDQIREIDKPTSHTGDALTPAVRAGADMRWQTWAQNRKALINQELALAMRDRELVRVEMTAALSRLEAAKRVEKRVLVQHSKDAERRSSW